MDDFLDEVPVSSKVLVSSPSKPSSKSRRPPPIIPERPRGGSILSGRPETKTLVDAGRGVVGVLRDGAEQHKARGEAVSKLFSRCSDSDEEDIAVVASWPKWAASLGPDDGHDSVEGAYTDFKALVSEVQQKLAKPLYSPQAVRVPKASTPVTPIDKLRLDVDISTSSPIMSAGGRSSLVRTVGRRSLPSTGGRKSSVASIMSQTSDEFSPVRVQELDLSVALLEFKTLQLEFAMLLESALPSLKKQHDEHTLIWHEEVLPKWDQKKSARKTRSMVWDGIPPRARGDAWVKMIGNPLQITEELFTILLSKARSVSRRVTRRLTGGPNTPSRGTVTRGREDSVYLIQTDLNRTFPSMMSIPGMEQGSLEFRDRLESLLKDILEAYVLYRPDVGYVQGMSYLAGMLLIYMDKYNAFVCMATILNTGHFFNFFRMDVDHIRCLMQVFKKVMAEQLSTLFKHFEANSLEPDMYALDWFLTMFTRALPLHISSRVWDNYFFEGEAFIFRTALGLLKHHQADLLEMNFDDLMAFFRNIPQSSDGNAFMASVRSIKLSKEKFRTLVSSHMAKLVET